MQDQVDVLLVEDEENDALFMKKAFETVAGGRSVCVVRDGQEALDFLMRVGDYEMAPRPCLILMDINMPRKNGHEALQEIKAVDGLLDIPVIMYSSSKIPEDIKQSYAHHANAYVSKPRGFDKMLEFVRTFNDFWFGHVSLPAS